MVQKHRDAFLARSHDRPSGAGGPVIYLGTSLWGHVLGLEVVGSRTSALDRRRCLAKSLEQRLVWKKFTELLLSETPGIFFVFFTLPHSMTPCLSVWNQNKGWWGESLSFLPNGTPPEKLLACSAEIGRVNRLEMDRDFGSTLVTIRSRVSRCDDMSPSGDFDRFGGVRNLGRFVTQKRQFWQIKW